QSLAGAGVAFDESQVIDGKECVVEAELAVKRLLESEKRPTAIIACGDTGACGVVAAARALGLNVPAHLSIVGIGTTASAGYVGPGITSVEFSRTSMAELATHILLDALNETNRASASELIVEVELVTRRSTARVVSS